MTTPNPTRPGREHALLRLLVTRAFGALTLLLVLSFLVFVLMYLAPGDLVKTLLGPKQVSAEAVATIRAQYRLDDPLIVQYLHWLGQAFSGDFGTSIRYQAPVSSVIEQRAGATLLLASLSFVVTVAISVPLGLLAARRVGRATDRAVVSLTVLGVSAPAFAVSLLLILIFAFSLGWFPIYGIGDGGIDTLWHLVLPVVALVVGLSALLTKITRTALLREFAHDSLTFAKARGLSQHRINTMALRGALIPILTGAGLTLSSLVGGAIFVETVFALPGLGTLLQDAVLFKDVPVVQAVTLLIAVFIVAIAVIVDLLSLTLDPRLRHREGVSA